MAGPMFERRRRGGLQPYDGTARGPDSVCQLVDIRHDVARDRNLERKALGNEIVLHVDHHEGRAPCFDGVMAGKLALTADDAFLDGGRNGVGVHDPVSSLVQIWHRLQRPIGSGQTCWVARWDGAASTL